MSGMLGEELDCSACSIAILPVRCKEKPLPPVGRGRPLGSGVRLRYGAILAPERTKKGPEKREEGSPVLKKLI